MAKQLPLPFFINKRATHVEEVDELTFLLGNYRTPIPAKARALILERAFDIDKRAADRRKRKRQQCPKEP